MGRSTRVVNMSVDESLYEGVDRLAREKGTSRSQVLRFESLGVDDLEKLVQRAEALTGAALPLEPEARQTLLTLADGDGSRQPSANELAIARYQGLHVAGIARRLMRT